MTASPMNFSTVAAVPRDQLARRLEIAAEGLADLLGVALLGEWREPDEIGEQDGDEAPLRHRAGRRRARVRAVRAVRAGSEPSTIAG